MRSALRTAVCAVTAVVVMALAVGGARAYDLQISPGGGFTWASSSLTFSDAGGIIRVVCPVTFDGTLDSGPIENRAGQTLGSIDDVTPGTCTGGAMRVLSADSRLLSVVSVLGTLPGAMTGLLAGVGDFRFELAVTILGIPVRCLYAGDVGVLMPTPALWTGPPAPQYELGPSGTFLSNILVPKESSAAAVCPVNGRFNGSFRAGYAHIVVVT